MARKVSLLMITGLHKKAAVADVAKDMNVSSSTVYAACKEHSHFFPLRKSRN
jgi:hypothetical protein